MKTSLSSSKQKTFLKIIQCIHNLTNDQYDSDKLQINYEHANNLYYVCIKNLELHYQFVIKFNTELVGRLTHYVISYGYYLLNDQYQIVNNTPMESINLEEADYKSITEPLQQKIYQLDRKAQDLINNDLHLHD